MLGFDLKKKPIDEDLEEPVESVKSVGPVEHAGPKSSTIIGVCISIVLILFVIVVYKFVIGRPNTAKANAKSPIVTATPNTTTAVKGIDVGTEGATKAGLPDLNTGGTSTNTKVLDKTAEFLKDLNHKDIKPEYVVKTITKITDFINYEKKRASTADGLELYWLDAVYKDRPYKVQVPFQIFKELEPKGITVVDLEILNLSDNSQVVSYMSVRSDYKRLLERK